MKLKIIFKNTKYYKLLKDGYKNLLQGEQAQ